MEKGTRALDVMKDTMRVISRVSLVTLLACGVTACGVQVGVPKEKPAEGATSSTAAPGTVSETEGTSIGVGDEEARPQAGEDYQDDADTADEEDWEDWEESGEDEDAAWDDAFDEEQEGEHADESEERVRR